MLTINKIIWLLIISSFVLETASGLTSPLFAVFLTNNIAGGTLEVIGFAAAIYWILKSLLQLLVGYYLDKLSGEADDLTALIAGHVIFGITFFLYILAKTPTHIYLIESLAAVGGALLVPSWYGIFIRHIDKYKEDFEWSVNSSLSFGLGTGLAGAIGGIMVTKLGFETTFAVAGTISLISAVISIPLYKYLRTN